MRDDTKNEPDTRQKSPGREHQQTVQMPRDADSSERLPQDKSNSSPQADLSTVEKLRHTDEQVLNQDPLNSYKSAPNSVKKLITT